jgi:hypothetical protein
LVYQIFCLKKLDCPWFIFLWSQFWTNNYHLHHHHPKRSFVRSFVHPSKTDTHTHTYWINRYDCWVQFLHFVQSNKLDVKCMVVARNEGSIKTSFQIHLKNWCPTNVLDNDLHLVSEARFNSYCFLHPKHIGGVMGLKITCLL